MLAVVDLKHLVALFRERRSVISRPTFCHVSPLPAAVVVNMQGVTIQRMIDNGLFVYEPKAKQEFHKAVRKYPRTKKG